MNNFSECSATLNKNKTFPAIVKPLIKSDLLSRVHFHSTKMDWEKFYQDYIPKSCLPSDYGGELDSIKVLHKKQCGVLEDINEFFYHDEKLLAFGYEDDDIDGHERCDTKL
jgi:CRAL/TRIO domain